MKSLLKIITVLMLFSSNFSAFAQEGSFYPPAPINDYIPLLMVVGIAVMFIFFYKRKKAIQN